MMKYRQTSGRIHNLQSSSRINVLEAVALCSITLYTIVSRRSLASSGTCCKICLFFPSQDFTNHVSEGDGDSPGVSKQGITRLHGRNRRTALNGYLRSWCYEFCSYVNIWLSQLQPVEGPKATELYVIYLHVQNYMQYMQKLLTIARTRPISQRGRTRGGVMPPRAF